MSNFSSPSPLYIESSKYTTSKFEEMVAKQAVGFETDPDFAKILEDLQGNILLFHKKKYTRFYFIHFKNDQQNLLDALQWIEYISSYITSAKEQFNNRAEPVCCFYLTWEGYRRLKLSHLAPSLELNKAFSEGMRNRVGFTFDKNLYDDRLYPNAAGDRSVHAMLMIASDKSNFSDINSELLFNIESQVKATEAAKKAAEGALEVNGKVTEGFVAKTQIGAKAVKEALAAKVKESKKLAAKKRLVAIESKEEAEKAAEVWANLKVVRDREVVDLKEKAEEIKARLKAANEKSMTAAQVVAKAEEIKARLVELEAARNGVQAASQEEEKAKAEALETAADLAKAEKAVKVAEVAKAVAERATDKEAKAIIAAEAAIQSAEEAEKAEIEVEEVAALVASMAKDAKIAAEEGVWAYFTEQKGLIKLRKEFDRGNGGEDGKVVEWFGFRDGISQPLFFPDARPREKPITNNITDSVAPLRLVLTRDRGGQYQHSAGSFLAFLKLEQNVKQFRDNVSKIAEEITNGNEELAAAYIMGRFQDGTSVSLAKKQLAESLQEFPENNFQYSKVHPFTDSNASDEKGIRCPFAAHARKANPRNEKEAVFIVRRGVCYDDRGDDYNSTEWIDEQPTKDVGLLFMSFQRSLDKQFEHILNDWLLGVNTGKRATGVDMLAGTGFNRNFSRWRIPEEWGGEDANKKKLVTPDDIQQCVHFKGGEYFFAPSISFLENVRLSTINSPYQIDEGLEGIMKEEKKIVRNSIKTPSRIVIKKHKKHD